MKFKNKTTTIRVLKTPKPTKIKTKICIVKYMKMKMIDTRRETKKFLSSIL